MTRSSSGHVHDKSCYWDLNQCGWVCPPPAAAAPAASSAVRPSDEPGADAPAGSPAEASEVVRST